MKNLLKIVFYLFTFLPFMISAQEQSEKNFKVSNTKLEEFLAKKGEIIIKDFYKLDEIKGKYGAKIKFDIIKIYEPGYENESIRGMKIEIVEGGRYDRPSISFLDFDEVESLSKALEYMIDLSGKWALVEKEYTEVIFKTKSDFRIGFYQNGIDQVAFSSSSSMIMSNFIFSNIRDLNSVKIIVDKGLKLLNDL